MAGSRNSNGNGKPAGGASHTSSAPSQSISSSSTSSAHDASSSLSARRRRTANGTGASAGGGASLHLHPHGSGDALPERIVLAKRPSLRADGRTSYRVQAPGTPFDELDLSEVDFLRHDLADPYIQPAIQRGLTRYRRLFFLLGILLGALAAWALASRQAFERHMQSFMNGVEEQISGLGLGIDLGDLKLGVPSELSDLGDKLFSGPRELFKTKDFTVGRNLLSQGYKAEHPVILLPGIISTGLESWTTNAEMSGYFRRRLWGTTTMMRTIVFEKDMWVKHLSLDPFTGLDPDGIKVRAAEGFDAASYFVSGYWIWSKVIENLAVLGYDSNNLWLASYDWRLSMHNLEGERARANEETLTKACVPE